MLAACDHKMDSAGPQTLFNADIPVSLRQFCDCPASNLSLSTRSFIGRYLDPERNLSPTTRRLQDWRGLSEELGFNPLDISYIARSLSPTATLLNDWLTSMSPKAAVGELLNAICEIERFDLLNDDVFLSNLARDLNTRHNHIQRIDLAPVGLQVNEVDSGSDDTEHLTVTEVNTGKPEYFEAFICHAEPDFPFVQQLMNQLEVKHKIKLCVAERDLLLGGFKLEDKIKLISQRCNKMIVVLSPDYYVSEECKFLTAYACSMESSVKQRKLIPVIWRPCQVPPILSILLSVDFTRSECCDRNWIRLASSLRSQSTSSIFSPSTANHRAWTTDTPSSSLLESSGIFTDSVNSMTSQSAIVPAAETARSGARVSSAMPSSTASAIESRADQVLLVADQNGRVTDGTNTLNARKVPASVLKSSKSQPVHDEAPARFEANFKQPFTISSASRKSSASPLLRRAKRFFKGK